MFKGAKPGMLAEIALKCLSLKQRVEMINYAKNHPKESYRKVAEKFGIGRTQAQKILKEKEVILAEYENSENGQCGRGRGCEQRNAGKLERARKRDHTRMESRECVEHG